MNNRYLIIILILIVLAGAGVYLHEQKKSPQNSIANTAVGTVATSSRPIVPVLSSSTPSVSTSISTSHATTTTTTVPINKAKLALAVVAKYPDAVQFTVRLNGTTSDAIGSDLLSQGFITSQDQFGAALGSITIAPGAYKLSPSMSVSEMVTVLQGDPYMKWVVIPEGLRKEEIAGLLATALGWTSAQKNTFITKDTTTDPEYIEGVYFPTTYLIPIDESTSDVAKRLISKFNDNFASYLPEFTAQNVKWTKALTLASIVQREAASDSDAPLIAGILWNRLNQNMPLDVDATIQYARGNTGSGWWAPITKADEKIDSPFNTYTNTGLPPHSISNPGLAAIDAVLNPTQTDCLYYIHDSNRVTHCAATLEEQDANIQKYLVNQ